MKRPDPPTSGAAPVLSVVSVPSPPVAVVAAGTATTGASAVAAEPIYSDVGEFVDHFVLPHYRHQLFKDVRWCAYWWEHTAAVTRLEYLHEAFEHMCLDDPPSKSVWLRDHFDKHMSVLTVPTGVFWRCDATTGVHEIAPLWPTSTRPLTQFTREPDPPPPTGADTSTEQEHML